MAYGAFSGAVSLSGAGSSASTGYWTDVVTITGGTGSAGTTGTASLQSLVSGNGTFTGSGYAQLADYVEIESEADYLANVAPQQVTGGNYSYPYSPPWSITQSQRGTFSFTYGTPYVLRGLFTAIAGTDGTGTAALNINTFEVSDIVLPQGATLTALSGTQYPDTVPLPGTPWLFSSGLIGLLSVRRKK